MKQERSGDIGTWIILAIIIIAVLVVAVPRIIRMEEALDQFCINKRHTEHTGHKRYTGNPVATYSIECDSEEIYHHLEKRERCVQEDKWRDCEKEQTYFTW